MKEMVFHQLTDVFPLLDESELNELAEDIRENGLLEPIWLFHGQIIDGRNRYLACRKAGVEPHYRTWNGKGSLVLLVLSLNLHRRHLTQSQKAAIASGVLGELAEEARLRKRVGEKPQYQLPALLQEATQLSATLQTTDQKEAVKHAAALFGVSPRYIYDAKAIEEKAPVTFEQIRSGEKTIYEAKRELRHEQGQTDIPFIAPTETERLRARVAELEAENAELREHIRQLRGNRSADRRNTVLHS